MTVQPKRKQRFLFPKRLLSLLIMALLVGCIVLMGLRLFLLRGWSSLPKPSMKYVPSLLEQAPCLAGVCVGMVGREAVFEALSQSDLISGIRDNGGSTIGFYINGRLPMGVIFAQDEHGQYEVVERFNLQAPGISLEMILSALGEPDNLFLMFGCGNGVYIHANSFTAKRELKCNYNIRLVCVNGMNQWSSTTICHLPGHGILTQPDTMSGCSL